MRVSRVFLCILVGLSLPGQIASLFGQSVTALIHDVSNAADGSITQAGLEAQRQAMGAGPAYRSSEKDDFRTFSGRYTPPELPEDKKGRFVYGLALFSDDGCNVTLDGSLIHERLGQAQHLPDIGTSFQVLQTVLAPGEPIDITVNYSNIIYNDDPKSRDYPDIDGCTLFLYLIPAAIAVDSNRDGTIAFSGEARDTTSQDAPFRFWRNDDQDQVTADGENDVVPARQADHLDDIIQGRRDLEDFSRLWLRFEAFSSEIANGTLKVGLKWKDFTDAPAIKVYKSANTAGSTSYLTDDAAASAQVDGANRVAIGTVSTGGDMLILPADFWSSSSAQNKCLIFEGASEGKGQLVITVNKSDATQIVEGPSVWLDLVNVRKMYRRVKATGIADNFPEPSQTTSATPPEPTMGWVEDPNANVYDDSLPVSWRKTNQQIVFIHGWNMTYEESQNFAETMFKRLWQRGFKGRYAFMRWPTMDASFVVPYTYNASEYRAWKCGESLKQFIASLPSDHTKNLVSHSMGGIVCGSALQKGMSIDNYVLCHAAVPAACYDENPTLDQGWGYATPHYDPDEGTRHLSYRYKLNSAIGNLTNFFLPADDALEAWELNNYTSAPFSLGAKPQRYNAGTTGYYYNPGAPAGQRLAINYHTTVGRYVTTPDEAMAYVAQSPTKTVGADGRTAGSIDDKVDLTGFGFGGVHSAEFTFTLQKTTPFYNELLRRCDIAFLP